VLRVRLLIEKPCTCHNYKAEICCAQQILAWIHDAIQPLRAILRATVATYRGYTVGTFRGTLRAILDQRLPSSYAMMFTSRNPKWRHLGKKKGLGVLALMLLDGEEKARTKRRNRRVWVRGWIASNIKADKRSE